MCGIVGFTGPPDANQLKAMISLVKHRGPDEDGKYSDRNVSLGHARLKIIDLNSGKQPMYNQYQNIWVVFNGEVYNFVKLRAELEKEGCKFNTNSDTEVIVNGYEKWGTKVFERLHGCFAIAIWDRLNKKLILARDRIGIKPLYYAVLSHRLLFASEVKALLAWDELKREVDEQAFRELLTFQYTLEDKTLFKGVKTVLPGHFITISADGLTQERYWDVSFKERNVSEQGAIALVRRLLSEAVYERTVSDVPIGAFLSGGLDSSYVVGLLSRALHDPVKTFSVGFGEQDDELSKARVVADVFATDHKEIMVEPSPAIIPEITWHNDFPVVNIAALPTYLMAKATKPFVSVVLTGDGGDELFAGYERYERVKQWHDAPLSLRGLGSRVASRSSNNPLWNRLQEFAGFEDQEHSFLAYQSSFSPKEIKSLTGNSMLPRIEEFFPEHREILTNMFAFDTTQLLPNDYLMKVDKMSMAHGLEARVPFLDHRLVEFSAGIPPELKLAGGKKYLLRKAMRGFVPDVVLDQKKQGFNVPTAKWLQGDFGIEAGERLSSKCLVKLLKPSYVKKVLAGFQRYPRYYSRQFWTIYAFQVWWEMFIKPESLDLKAMNRSVSE